VLQEVTSFSALDVATQDNTALIATVEAFIKEHPPEENAIVDAAVDIAADVTDTAQAAIDE
jgi:hypothetical protein